MKNTKTLTKIIIAVLLITLIIIIVHILITINIWYYNKDFFDNKDSYDMIATLCYNDYLGMCEDNEKIEETCYTGTRGNDKTMLCYTDNHQLHLNDEECKAIDKIHYIFIDDTKDLDVIRVQDNFVSFCIVNGRASYIYSVNDEKPTFVNSDDDKNEFNYIRVTKITDHWYYAYDG